MNGEVSLILSEQGDNVEKLLLKMQKEFNIVLKIKMYLIIQNLKK
jgi:hypothetical protein